MNKVYDNGYYLLGEVKNIILMVEKTTITSDIEEEINEIVEDLKENYKSEDIVCIYYDNPMGYNIELFRKEDIIF